MNIINNISKQQLVGSPLGLSNLTHFLHTAKLLQLPGAYHNNDSVLSFSV